MSNSDCESTDSESEYEVLSSPWFESSDSFGDGARVSGGVYNKGWLVKAGNANWGGMFTDIERGFQCERSQRDSNKS